MRNIYIVLTQTYTLPARIIALATKDKYSHASISLDIECNHMYSFARKYRYFPLIGCFNIEDIHKGLFVNNKKSSMAIYELKVTEYQYHKIKEKINLIKETSTGYNMLGLFLAKFRIKLNRNKYYCSEFVYELLSDKKVKIIQNKVLFRPMELLEIKNLKLIYEGYISDYNVKKNCACSMHN